MRHFFIVPSLACPAGCKYCFGPHEGSGIMDKSTLEGLMRFLRNMDLKAICWGMEKGRNMLFLTGNKFFVYLFLSAQRVIPTLTKSSLKTSISGNKTYHALHASGLVNCYMSFTFSELTLVSGFLIIATLTRVQLAGDIKSAITTLFNLLINKTKMVQNEVLLFLSLIACWLKNHLWNEHL